MPWGDCSRHIRWTALAALLFASAAPARANAQALTDLVLDVTRSPSVVVAGGTATFSVGLSNVGNVAASGVTVLLNVPANVRYQGFTVGTGASCSGMTVNQAGPGTLTCSHPTLIQDAAGLFTVTLQMTAQGVATVTSSVSATQGDATPANNSDSDATTVTAGADVSVTLSAPTPLASGSSFNYALSVTNAGPNAATLLRVTFPLPAGFTQSGGLPAGCSVSGGTLTCNIAGPIASGATVSVGNVPGKITAASGSTVSGTASIGLQPGAPSSTAQDPNSANNTSTSSITVTSINTPTTVASAAPDSKPNKLIAAATASSKKLEAPIKAEGQATLWASPNWRLSQ
jgi:uncharacterized repeat protein (TIGR01451 family)